MTGVGELQVIKKGIGCGQIVKEGVDRTEQS